MLTGTYDLPAASRDAYRASNLSKRTPEVPSAVSKARKVSSHSFVFWESHAVPRPAPSRPPVLPYRGGESDLLCVEASFITQGGACCPHSNRLARCPALRIRRTDLVSFGGGTLRADKLPQGGGRGRLGGGRAARAHGLPRRIDAVPDPHGGRPALKRRSLLVVADGGGRGLASGDRHPGTGAAPRLAQQAPLRSRGCLEARLPRGDGVGLARREGAGRFPSHRRLLRC